MIHARSLRPSAAPPASPQLLSVEAEFDTLIREVQTASGQHGLGYYEAREAFRSLRNEYAAARLRFLYGRMVQLRAALPPEA